MPKDKGEEGAKNGNEGSSKPSQSRRVSISQIGTPKNLENPPRKQQEIERKVYEGAIKKLHESPERGNLRDLLKKRLKDVGWEEEMREYCREIIRNKCLEDLAVESLVEELTPKSRAAAPDFIRSEIMDRITRLLNKS